MRIFGRIFLIAGLLVPTSVEAQERVPQWVFTPDERVRVVNTLAVPYRGVVYFEAFDPQTGWGSSCSGAMIGPRIVLTAAHCIYSADTWGGYAGAVNVYPARNGILAAFFSSGVSWAVPEQYKPLSGDVTAASERWDYGVILLAEAPDTGWFTVGSLSTATLATSAYTVTGYDADKPNKTMWTRSGSRFLSTLTFLRFLNSSYGGSSGAPIYRSSDKMLIGINQGGYDSVPLPAFGRRVDAEVLAFIRSVCTAPCSFSSYVENAISPIPTPIANPTPTATTASRTKTLIPLAVR